MKTITITLGLVIVMGVLVSHTYGTKTEVIHNVTPQISATSTEEVVVEEWMTDEDAIQAAKDVIRKKELTALEAQLVTEITSKQEELDEVRKELGTYWRDPNNLKTLIRQTFPERPEVAIAIANCESGMRTNVQSNHILSYGREQSFGLFQIHAKVHHETALRLGLPDYKTDPEQNAQMARHIYEAAGHSFQPWTCYTQNMIAMR